MSNIIPHKHAHFFYSAQQQANSAKLGMWLFLVTEVLLFSGLFVGYTVIKTLHPEMWKVASEQLNWQLGSVNTLVLITSSWTVALAVRAAQTNKKGENNGKIVGLLAFSILCAGGFMGIKYMEYSHKFHDGLLWGTKYFAHPEALAHLKSDIASLFGIADVQLSSPEILETLKGKLATISAESKHAAEHVIHHYNSTVVYKDSLMTVEQGHLFFGIYFLLTGLHGIHVIIGAAILLCAPVAGSFITGTSVYVDGGFTGMRF